MEKLKGIYFGLFVGVYNFRETSLEKASSQSGKLTFIVALPCVSIGSKFLGVSISHALST